MKITPEVINALEAVRERNEEKRLDTEDVVDAAADPKSPLHSAFTWDEGEAAHKCRIREAQDLIMRVTYIVPSKGDTTIPIRYYTSLASDRVSGGGYRATTEVLSRQDWREELLRTALAELQNLQKRYQTLVELVPVFDAVEKVDIKRSKKAASKVSKARRRQRIPVTA